MGKGRDCFGAFESPFIANHADIADMAELMSAFANSYVVRLYRHCRHCRQVSIEEMKNG
jgi:hypothetical protein